MLRLFWLGKGDELLVDMDGMEGEGVSMPGVLLKLGKDWDGGIPGNGEDAAGNVGDWGNKESPKLAVDGPQPLLLANGEAALTIVAGTLLFSEPGMPNRESLPMGWFWKLFMPAIGGPL